MSKKKENREAEIKFRARADWKGRLQYFCRNVIGVPMSQFIRQAVNKEMNRIQQEDAA